MKTLRTRTTATVTGSLVFGVVVLFGESITPTTPVPPVGSPGGPDSILSPAELQSWIAGRLVFDHDVHSVDGLGSDNGAGGPDFNADSCRACHEDPAIGGAGGLDLNVSLFGFDNGGQGPFTNLPGGPMNSKLRRPGLPGRENQHPLADVFEQRNTPSLHGAGLIDSISDAEIMSHEDPMDLNGDGIFGVAHIVTLPGGTQEVGRFGWKAGVPRLRDFARAAMGGELGVTVPPDGRGFGLLDDNDGVPDPELGQQELDDIVFFMSHLAPPRRRGSISPLVAQGEVLFTQIGCSVCHIPSLMGAGGPIRLYSNLLLHNVHPPGFRGMVEGMADVGFYRTPPLWGISGTAPYMHDGSAETLRDAILAHDGEALDVRTSFAGLTAAEQQALILFLEDL